MPFMGVFYKKEEDQIRKIAREEAIKVADEITLDLIKTKMVEERLKELECEKE